MEERLLRRVEDVILVKHANPNFRPSLLVSDRVIMLSPPSLFLVLYGLVFKLWSEAAFFLLALKVSDSELSYSQNTKVLKQSAFTWYAAQERCRE